MNQGEIETYCAPDGRWRNRVTGDSCPLTGEYDSHHDAARVGLTEARERRVSHVVSYTGGTVSGSRSCGTSGTPRPRAAAVGWPERRRSIR